MKVDLSKHPAQHRADQQLQQQGGAQQQARIGRLVSYWKQRYFDLKSLCEQLQRQHEGDMAQAQQASKDFAQLVSSMADSPRQQAAAAVAQAANDVKQARLVAEVWMVGAVLCFSTSTHH